MGTCIHVFMHELRKVLSDKKILGSIFLLPLLVVFMTSFLSAGEPQGNTQQEIYHIYVLNNALDQQRINDEIEILPVSYDNLAELEENVKLQKEDVVLEITELKTTIYFNSTNAISQNLSMACKQLLMDIVLEDFANANMVDIASRITTTDVNEQADISNRLAATLFPYMLVLLLFQSTSDYAVDTIAGEKERGVFSKLLLAPVSPTPVISGKLLSSTMCGVLSTLVYILVVTASASITGNDTFGLYEANITLPMVVLLIICAILLSWLFACLSILCSLYAKTVKETQTMRLPVYGATMVLALAAMLRTGAVAEIFYLIPIYNICIMMQDILTSSVEIWKMLITVFSLFACSIIIAFIMVLSFWKESIRC